MFVRYNGSFPSYTQLAAEGLEVHNAHSCQHNIFKLPNEAKNTSFWSMCDV